MASILLPRIDDCLAGGVFYVCNGFRGCCAIDPCMPGSTCPADKDLTSGRSPDDASSIVASQPQTTASSSTTRPSSSLSTITTTRTESLNTAHTSSDTYFSVSLAEPSYPTVTENAAATAPPPTAAPSTSSHAHSTPVAVIVGAVLGSIILCGLLLAFLFCVRRRRLTKVYKAPSYPSPFVGSDMTPQLSSKASSQFQQKIAALYKADTVERCEPAQLDSREILHQHRRRDSIRRFAELPAEPLPWPGHLADR